MMLNHFNLTTHVSNLWFFGFSTTSISGFVAVCCGLAAIAFSFEAFACVRIVLQQRASDNPLRYGHEEQRRRRYNVNEDQAAPLLRSLTLPVTWELVRTRKMWYHVAESLTFLLQLCVGYVLMLAVMSYNGYLVMAVVVGAGLGRYVLTASLPSSPLDVTLHEQRQVAEIIAEYGREEERVAAGVGSYGAVNT